MAMYCFSIPPQKDPGFTENFVSLVLIWSSQLPFINFVSIMGIIHPCKCIRTGQA